MNRTPVRTHLAAGRPEPLPPRCSVCVVGQHWRCQAGTDTDLPPQECGCDHAAPRPAPARSEWVWARFEYGPLDGRELDVARDHFGLVPARVVVDGEAYYHRGPLGHALDRPQVFRHTDHLLAPPPR